MDTKVTLIKAGLGYVYLIKNNKGSFLVDAGNKGYEKKILQAVKAAGVEPTQLKFIFITHAHYDHVGSAAALTQHTGAPVIVQQHEEKHLKQGYGNLPGGTAPLYKGLIFLGKKAGKTFSKFPPVKPALTFNGELNLKDKFGIEGRIIHTPGHTYGSATLFIDNMAFVGDTVFNIWKGKIIYPVFADNQALLKESWRKLLEHEFQYIYPAHGKKLTHREFYREALKKNIV